MVQVLRLVRQQRGLTLDDLALATGLTKSYLSKVERGHSVPSISAAVKIARALDVDVAQMFSDDPEANAIAVERRAVSSSRHHPLASGMLGKAMSPFLVRPGLKFAAQRSATHTGQEFMFVHTGRVELKYGDRTVDLGTGDSVYLDAATPHKLRQIGPEPAEVLVVVYDRTVRGPGGS